MAERIYRFIALAALAFWIGGTRFYAVIVVSTGKRVVGATDQGFLTEQATRQLTWIGVASLVVLLPMVRKSRLASGSWLVLAATVAALFALQPRVAVYLNHTDQSVTDYTQFYAWHRYYLAATTIQWLVGLVQLW